MSITCETTRISAHKCLKKNNTWSILYSIAEESLLCGKSLSWQLVFQISKGQNLLYFRKPDITEGSEAREDGNWTFLCFSRLLTSKVSGIKYNLEGFVGYIVAFTGWWRILLNCLVLFRNQCILWIGLKYAMVTTPMSFPAVLDDHTVHFTPWM